MSSSENRENQIIRLCLTRNFFTRLEEKVIVAFMTVNFPSYLDFLGFYSKACTIDCQSRYWGGGEVLISNSVLQPSVFICLCIFDSG